MRLPSKEQLLTLSNDDLKTLRTRIDSVFEDKKADDFVNFLREYFKQNPHIEFVEVYGDSNLEEDGRLFSCYLSIVDSKGGDVETNEDFTIAFMWEGIEFSEARVVRYRRDFEDFSDCEDLK